MDEKQANGSEQKTQKQTSHLWKLDFRQNWICKPMEEKMSFSINKYWDHLHIKDI